MKRLFRGSVCALLKNLSLFVLLVLALPAWEARAATINFLTIDQPDVVDGAIGYAGGPNRMVAGVGGVRAIDVDFIFGTDTALHSGLGAGIACVNCTLSFFTGIRASGPGLAFDGGGQIAVVGTVPAAGILAPRLLLAGTFEGAFVVDVDPAASELVAFAAFLDVKSSDLASYFGMPGGPDQLWHGAFGMGLVGVPNPVTGAFLMEVVGGVNNFAGLIINTIPTPGTLSLFALVLLGMSVSGVAARRRMTTATAAV